MKQLFFKGCIYISSCISIFILGILFVFIIQNGKNTLSFDLLKNHYWPNNYVGIIQQEDGYFARPVDLHQDALWSERWGIGVIDVIEDNQSMILVEAMDKHSPFAQLQDYNHKTPLSIEIGHIIQRIQIKNLNNEITYIGSVTNNDAHHFMNALDNALSIQNVYFQTVGGGIIGSIQATLLLIVVSLSIAIPLGLGAAIYISEYMHESYVQKGLKSMIEMLSGVPSIIYSLIGLSVLYPITTLFGASTTSILLGGMTLSIILLPILIRSVEEALLVVPQGLKDASLSLGATKFQTIYKVILPYAFLDILNTILLCIGRILAESAALIYTMGTFINDTPHLLSQGTSLALHIYQIMSSETPNFSMACAVAIVILVIILLLQCIVVMISYIMKKKVH